MAARVWRVVGLAATLASGCTTPKPRGGAPSATAAARSPPASAAATATVVGPASARDVQALVEGGNAFGFALYDQLRVSRGNLAISPASVHIALAMLWTGAGGETAAQLTGILRLDTDRKGVLSGAHELTSRWSEGAPGSQPLIVRNGLFHQDGVELGKTYVADVRAAFGAQIASVDFRAQPEPSRQTINTWVKQQTNDRIAELLPGGSVTRQTRLVLTDAILFRGQWRQAFSERATSMEPFHTDSGKTRRVPTMRADATFAYAHLGDRELLEIPYAGGALAMTFVLPRLGRDLEKVEHELSGLTSWLAKTKPRKLIVQIPRATIDPPTSMLLREPLRRMGLTLPFDDDRADFSAIAVLPTGERLTIDEIVHKTFVRIDEQGTEAAAATAVIGEIAISARGTPPLIFNADHPFVWFIRDVRTGEILFLGRVADPR